MDISTEPIRALFKDGVFIPQGHVGLADGSDVELTVRSSKRQSPSITDPDERQEVLDRLLERMDRHPLPVPASSLTRESLHERT